MSQIRRAPDRKNQNPSQFMVFSGGGDMRCEFPYDPIALVKPVRALGKTM
jgi:hypothetical protein